MWLWVFRAGLWANMSIALLDLLTGQGTAFVVFHAALTLVWLWLLRWWKTYDAEPDSLPEYEPNKIGRQGNSDGP